MGGCMQSKNAAAPALADEFSSGKINNRGFSFWKNMKDHRLKMIRVAPAPLEHQCVTKVSERTIVGMNQLPAARRPCSREDDSPSPTFSEVSLSRYMITEDNADGDQLMDLEISERPQTPHLCIMGTPLFEKKINKKKELRARQDSKEIIRQLRDSGIVARPETRPGGISYEYFVKEKFALLKKPPVRLRKLKKAKKARDAKGDTKLREEMESHMQMAEKRRKKVIDNVRIQQTKHLVLDTQKALENSAQLEEEKILQQKEMMREVVKGRESTNRDLLTMQKKHHRTEMRLRGALQKMAEKDELGQARNIIEVRPLRYEEQDQSEDEEMVGDITY